MSEDWYDYIDTINGRYVSSAEAEIQIRKVTAELKEEAFKVIKYIPMVGELRYQNEALTAEAAAYRAALKEIAVPISNLDLDERANHGVEASAIALKAIANPSEAVKRIEAVVEKAKRLSESHRDYFEWGHTPSGHDNLKEANDALSKALKDAGVM